MIRKSLTLAAIEKRSLVLRLSDTCWALVLALIRLGRQSTRSAWNGASIERRPSLFLVADPGALHDLPASGAPHAGVRADVFERSVERTNPVRLAGDKRVHRDRHHAGDRFALAIERVELAPQHRLEFRHRHLHLEIGG